MSMQDILLDESGDLAIHVVRDAQGMIVSDLTIGDADYQNIRLVVLSNKGDFKERPILGVGAEKYLKSIGRANELRREISVQLQAIGYGKADVTVNNNGILNIDL